MGKLKGCTIKVKGGLRCGNPQLHGKKYCASHIPLPPPPKVKKKPDITTYSIGETIFSGEKKVKASQYDYYLQSPEWKKKANIEKELNPNCSLCNRKGTLHVHHRTYVRCGCEQPGDLIVLCNACHEMFHNFYKYDGRVGYFVPNK